MLGRLELELELQHNGFGGQRRAAQLKTVLVQLIFSARPWTRRVLEFAHVLPHSGEVPIHTSRSESILIYTRRDTYSNVGHNRRNASSSSGSMYVDR